MNTTRLPRLASQLAVGAVVIASMWGIGVQRGTDQIAAVYDGSTTDACVTAVADQVLTTLGITGVEVRVKELSQLDAGGTASPLAPRTIFIDTDAAARCSDPQAGATTDAGAMVPYTDELAWAIAHEAAHVAQHDLLGMRPEPSRQLLREVWPGDGGEGRLNDELGGQRLNDAGELVSAREWSADCTPQAYGYGTGFYGLGYRNTCTPADLEAAVAVVEGRWPGA